MSEVWREWTVFSFHGMVLFYVAANPDATMRGISDALGITERQVARILKHLEEAGMVQVERVGRRNRYTVNPAARLRHPTLSHVTLDRIIRAVVMSRPPADGGR